MRFTAAPAISQHRPAGGNILRNAITPLPETVSSYTLMLTPTTIASVGCTPFVVSLQRLDRGATSELSVSLGRQTTLTSRMHVQAQAQALVLLARAKIQLHRPQTWSLDVGHPN